MKATALQVVACAILITGCAHIEKKPALGYTPVPANESFSIGAFKPSKTECNWNRYDEEKAVGFLATLSKQFSEGDIVSVDGLKWQKTKSDWEPIPNPPIPVFKPGDDVHEYVRKYAVWIDDHPHFKYPPIPLNKE